MSSRQFVQGAKEPPGARPPQGTCPGQKTCEVAGRLDELLRFRLGCQCSCDGWSAAHASLVLMFRGLWGAGVFMMRSISDIGIIVRDRTLNAWISPRFTILSMVTTWIPRRRAASLREHASADACGRVLVAVMV